MGDADSMIRLPEKPRAVVWRKLATGMHATRQFTLLYGAIARILAAIGIVVLHVGVDFAHPKKSPRPSAAASSQVHITVAEFIILVIVSGLIMVAGLLAIGFYWRTKHLDARIAQENARQREVAKTLMRLRDRMSLPSLVELNRLTLTQYHLIATDQAQKSFRSSQRAMLIGFIWLIACFTAVVLNRSLHGQIIAATMAPVGSILAGFLGRTYLFVYEQALVQLRQYYNQPLLDSYYLAAERLASEMSHEARDRLSENAVEQLLAVARNLTEAPAQANASRRRTRLRVPGMRQVPADEDDGKDNSAMAAPAG